MVGSEVRDALTRRLNKNASDPSPSSAGNSQYAQVGRGLPPLAPVSGVGSGSNAEGANRSNVYMEGYLSKFSSGTFSRWQKRFFVLDGGRLSYYKKLPMEQPIPNKVFGMRRIRAVADKHSSDEREFELVFQNGKSYSIRASSQDDKLRWVTSLKAAISHFEKFGASDQDGEDGNDGTLSEDGGMTSMNGSVLSEASPKQAYLPGSPPKDSSSPFSSMLPSSHGQRRDTLQPWDVAEIDTTGLEKNFEEWFYFVPVDRGISASVAAIKLSHVVDACNRANNHLWSVLAGLPRSSELKAPGEALVKAKARLSSSSPESQDKVTEIIEEYYAKLVQYVNRALDLKSASVGTALSHTGRSASTLGLSGMSPHASSSMGDANISLAAELPVLMDCIAKMINLMDKLLPIPQPHCTCGYCDPSGVNLLKLNRSGPVSKKTSSRQLPPPVNCSNEKWRKSLRGLLQRIGGDIEVGLIEELQQTLQSCEIIWASSTQHNSVSSGVLGHGPCPLSHPLLEEVISPARGVALMTSFSTTFLQGAQSKCINAAQQWMAAYPQCSRLIAEHSSSALVAVINSLWRQFKRRSLAIAEAADAESERKYTESIRAQREAAFVNGGDTLIDLDHLIAFANEAVLVSRFCSKTWSNGVSSKFTPEVFVTCMEGLAVGYLSTAAEAVQAIVRIHFYPRLRFDLMKLFVSKNFQTSQTPMQYSKTMIQQLANAIDTRYGLPCVYDAVIALSAQAIMRAYLPALIKAKPKAKGFKSGGCNDFAEFLAKEIQIYRDLFAKEFPLPQPQLDENTTLFDHILRVVNEKDKLNLSVHFNITTKLVNSQAAQSFIVMSGIIKIREHEFYNDRKQITQLLASMKEASSGLSHSAAGSMEDDDSHDNSSVASSLIRANGNKSTIIVLGVGNIKQPWRFEE